MISHVQTTTPVPMLQEHVLRRQLKAELLQLQLLLDKTLLDDEMTAGIKEWHFSFTRALNTSAGDLISVNEQAILDRFIELLKDVLQDPFDRSLEEMSYLGNDGETYGYKALCFYLSSIPSELAGKSPFHPDLEELFTVSPHPIVEAVAEWLKNRGSSLETDPSIENEYQRMFATSTLPHMPTPERVRFRERARRHAAERAQSKFTASFTLLSEEEINSRVDSTFKETIDQLNESNARGKERSESIKARDAQRTQELEQQIAQLDEEIHEVNVGIDSLKKQFEDVEGKLSDQEKENLRVRLEMERLRAEIKRRKKKKRLALIRTICTVAACIAAPFVLPEMVSLLPANSGFSLTFAL